MQHSIKVKTSRLIRSLGKPRPEVTEDPSDEKNERPERR